MDDKYANARQDFSATVRILATSADTIQARLIEANESILAVTINEFDGDVEMKIRFARILDLLATDHDDLQTAATETTAHMSDFEAVKVAELICDFLTDLR